MSEMLGNQYFMARNYAEAKKYLLPVYEKNPSDKLVKRKLIICFFMTGSVSKAFDLFYELTLEDIDFIVHADPIFDDCPCEEIIKELNLENSSASKRLEEFIHRGMIWLFCNASRSLECFEKAAELERRDKRITEIVNAVRNYISKEKESV